MTDNDDHKLSDDELDAWLAGRDPVAQAYSELDKPAPPRELDERILARARESANKKPDFSKDVFIRPYATAATVLLCLTIAFLLLNDTGRPTPADIRSPVGPLERAVQIAPREPPGAETGEAAEALAPQQQPLEFDTATADSAARMPAINVNQVRRQADDNADAGVNIANAVEDALEEIAVTGNRLRSADTNGTAAGTAPVADRTAESREEIRVTGNFIEGDTGFRANRESWLQEIARLREAGDLDRAGEEANLFRERYPDADLEAELAALITP